MLIMCLKFCGEDFGVIQAKKNGNELWYMEC